MNGKSNFHFFDYREIMSKLNLKRMSQPLKATIGFTISNILQKGILFLAVPIYTRILTTQQYGRYSVFLSWIDIFEIITTFRISWGGFVVGLNKYEEDKDGYTSSLQCLSIFITSFFLLIYLVLRKYINSITDMTTEVTLLIFIIMYFMPPLKFWTIREREKYRYKYVLIITFVFSIATLGLGVVTAKISTQKDLAIIASRSLVQMVIGIFLIVINCKNRFVVYQKEYWKRTFYFNVPLIPYYLSMVILNNSDRIIIKKLVGETEAGIYSVAYTLSTAMLLFSTSINSVLQPWMYKHMKQRSAKKITKVVNASLFFIAGLNLFVIGLAPEIIRILAPIQYQHAIWIVPPLALSVTVMFFYQHFINVEFYFEESRLTAVASIGAAVTNLVLNYMFIPIFGYLAAGYTTLISYVVFGFTHYFFMVKVCEKNEFTSKIIDIGFMIIILAISAVITLVLLYGYYLNMLRYCVLVIILIAMLFNKKKVLDIFKGEFYE